NATWIPVKQEIAGNELPKSVFEKQTLVINDSNYTVTAESVDKGIIKINGNKLDIYGKEGVNSGKHFTAIYKLINGQLTICYNVTGNEYPETFETKGRRAYFLSVFEKTLTGKK
ncbi:MAG: TIGR03067 domain-containing protein, partial [Bacteroidia bacterium]